MEIKDYIENNITQRLRADGGWVDFVSQNDNVVTLQFQGECSKCLILDRCVDWIQQQIKADLNEEITIAPIRKKPYFQDI